MCIDAWMYQIVFLGSKVQIKMEQWRTIDLELKVLSNYFYFALSASTTLKQQQTMVLIIIYIYNQFVSFGKIISVR